jgi:outer membrane protein assembly factor BamE (lipoprotein component of BamABCDE complex)
MRVVAIPTAIGTNQSEKHMYKETPCATVFFKDKGRLFRMIAGGVVVAGLLGACSPVLNKRGYIAEPNLVAAVRPGVDNKDSVQSMLGSPSVTGTFNQNDWYYISKNSEKVAFFDDRVLNQNILVVHFNDKGYVAKIDHLTLADSRVIHPESKTTPTRGRELGFFEQIFGNVGRFSGGGAGAPEAGSGK